MERERDQFVTLDAMRGIAALGVMAFHAPILGAQMMPGGYLAVDLFFMLSGFVIANAYRKKLAQGMALRAFLYRRAIRLWPMLALGALLAIMLVGGHAGGLFLLPNPKSAANLYPGNPPMWSLLAEAIAYLVFGLGLWRAGVRVLLALVLSCAIGLGVLTFSGSGSVFFDFGAHWQTLGQGLMRLGFGFGTGLLLWHAWNRFGGKRRVTHWAWLPLLAVIGVMAMVGLDGGMPLLFALFVIFPAWIWIALHWQLPSPRFVSISADISYPLYCIHVPIIAAMATTGAREVAAMVILPALALALHHLVDVPARSWLTRMLRSAMDSDQTRIGIST